MSRELAQRAAKLSEKQWVSVLKGLDATSRRKLEQAINKVDKSAPKKKSSGRSSNKSSGRDNPIFATDQKRRGTYRFGKGKIPFYKPSSGYPDDDEAKEEPSGSLELQHCFGYSGHSILSKQNLIYRDGKLIYFLAAVGIVHDIASGSQQFFTDHNDDLTTVCVDPRDGSKMVATAQKDPKDTPGQGKDLPKIFIWNYETMETVVEIKKVCQQSINRVQWSPVTGYLYVICGDKNQTLKAYDVSGLSGKKADKKQREKANTAMIDTPSTSDKILGFEIRPSACDAGADELVFFCTNKVLVSTITEKNGKLTMKKPQAVKIKDKEKAFLCVQYLANGSFLAGGSSGNIYTCSGKDVVKVHKGVHGKAVADMKLLDGNVLVTASMDRSIKRFEVSETGDELKEDFDSEEIAIADSDFRFAPKAIAVDGGTVYVGTKTNQIISYGIESKEPKLLVDGHDGQIHALCCHPTEDVVITGGWDRAVKVWDPNTYTCLRTYEFPKAGSEEAKENDMHKDSWQMNGACMSPDGKWIVVGTEASGLAILSYDTLELQYTHQIPKANKNQKEIEGIAYLRFSPCGKHLAVAHMDAHLYIFNLVVKEGKPKLTKWKKGMKHRAAPSNLQWSEDSKFVKCLTRDYEVAHWQLNSSKKTGTFCVKIPDPDKLNWADDPLIAGWDVQGLYQADWDGTDLNDACLTKDKKLIFTGDDYGTVRLHNYPAVHPKACRAYTGHAEFVQGVELLASDSQLATCGGADMAIFLWKINRA